MVQWAKVLAPRSFDLQCFMIWVPAFAGMSGVFLQSPSKECADQSPFLSGSRSGYTGSRFSCLALKASCMCGGANMLVFHRPM